MLDSSRARTLPVMYRRAQALARGYLVRARLRSARIEAERLAAAVRIQHWWATKSGQKARLQLLKSVKAARLQEARMAAEAAHLKAELEARAQADAALLRRRKADESVRAAEEEAARLKAEKKAARLAKRTQRQAAAQEEQLKEAAAAAAAAARPQEQPASNRSEAPHLGGGATASAETILLSFYQRYVPAFAQTERVRRIVETYRRRGQRQIPALTPQQSDEAMFDELLSRHGADPVALWRQTQQVSQISGGGAPSSRRGTRTPLGIELLPLTVKELRARAAAEGVADDAIEEARDGDQPKEELIALIVAKRSGGGGAAVALEAELADQQVADWGSTEPVFASVRARQRPSRGQRDTRRDAQRQTDCDPFADGSELADDQVDVEWGNAECDDPFAGARDGSSGDSSSASSPRSAQRSTSSLFSSEGGTTSFRSRRAPRASRVIRATSDKGYRRRDRDRDRDTDGSRPKQPSALGGSGITGGHTDHYGASVDAYWQSVADEMPVSGGGSENAETDQLEALYASWQARTGGGSIAQTSKYDDRDPFGDF